MKILLFPASYPPVLGGLQTAVHSIARELVLAGHTVRVVTNRYPRALPKAETIDGVSVQRWQLLDPRSCLFRNKRFHLFLASLYYYPTTIARFQALMRSYRPDVVNVHFPDAQIPFALALRRRFSFRLVVSLHGHDVERFVADERACSGTPIPPAARPLQSLLCEADAVTACSSHLLDEAQCLEPSVTSKGVAIYNGIDPSRFRDTTPYQHPRPYVLALGRLTYKKGFDLLLEAFVRATAASPSVDLVLAGEGEERPALETLTRRLGLVGRVFFFGRATSDQVVRLLNGCLFLAVPSRVEPFGIVALEALAAGKPVLATRVGGMRQFLTDLFPGLHSPPGGLTMPVPPGTHQPVMLVEPRVESLLEGLQRLLFANPHPSTDSVICTLVQKQYSWASVASRYARVLAG
jgi:glycogen(starch) synthase